MSEEFEQEIEVHYGFIHVLGDDDGAPDMDAMPGPDDTRRGQDFGIVGAAVPGVLMLITGLHTGAVPFRVAVHDEAAPEPGSEWEEVVEVSYDAPTALVHVTAFEDGFEVELPAPGSYRVRYCARGMDAAHEQDFRDDGEPALDAYELHFWAAPPETPRVVRQTSKLAAYWAGVAQQGQ